MKKAFLTFVSITITTFWLLAGTPPTEVQKSFDQKFPNATNVKWGKENPTEWEANFVYNGIKGSANFTADGKWTETEMEIPTSQLPEVVASAIKKQFGDFLVVGAAKIDMANAETLYEADLKSGTKKKEVILKSDGTFVK